MAKIRIAKSDRNPDWIGYRFMCPGCHEYHMPDNSWQFNGDLDKPTFSPSVLVKGTKNISDKEAKRILSGEQIEPLNFVCHSFVHDGKIQFLGDCTHALAGKTVDLPDCK